jgi:hypothetical protein
MVGAGVHHGEGGVSNVVVEDILVSPGPVASLDVADSLQLSVREFHCEGCVVAVLADVLVRDDVAGLRPGSHLRISVEVVELMRSFALLEKRLLVPVVEPSIQADEPLIRDSVEEFVVTAPAEPG